MVWITALTSAAPVGAQTQLSGVVVDSSGAPIALVEVATPASRVLTGPPGRFSVIGAADADSTVVVFRRVGYRPHRLVWRTTLEGNVDLGQIVLADAPIRLEDIRVDALQPIMSARGVREFEFARREGVARYFFTAYDIERLKAFDLGAITRRVPGARTVENAQFGSAIEMMARGRRCTAVIIVDGIASSNPSPDLLVPPERIGAMWYTPGACTVHIWTKPLPTERMSSFEVGIRISRADYGSGAGAAVGGYVVFPLVPNRLVLSPAFDVPLGQADIRWQTQVALLLRAFGDQPALYVGGGLRFRKFQVGGAVRPSAMPIVLAGISGSFGAMGVFSEVVVIGPVQASERTVELVFGFGFRN